MEECGLMTRKKKKKKKKKKIKLHANQGMSNNCITTRESELIKLPCCCLPSETYGRNGVTPIFRFFPVPPQVTGVVGTL